MFPEDELSHLPGSAQRAIEEEVSRLTRATEADDASAIVGSVKDLVETVCKAIIDSLGQTYPSSPALPELGRRTLSALGLHPSGLQGRPSLRNLASAFVTALNSLASLRNSDGTGHGRAEPSDLDSSSATFAQVMAVGWCKWVLAAARRVMEGRAAIEEAVRDISGGAAFRRGQLPAFLASVHLPDLGPEDQHKLGIAVGRRWSVGDTFNVRDDVIVPMACGEETFPVPFATGVIEGLLIDYNGFVRVTPHDIDFVVDIALRLQGRTDVGTFLDELAELVEQSDASFAVEAATLQSTIERLNVRIGSDAAGFATSLERLVVRLGSLLNRVASDEID